MKQKIKTNWLLCLFCLALATLFLTICSKTSPLYTFHDWFDSNAFLTVGRGILKGLVPYRDLFEQKGPILYFLHAIAAIISDRTFIGVWILQIITFSIFLFYTAKIIKLYLPKHTCYYILPIFTFFIFMMKSYRYGDSAEEFCLPLLMISFYGLLQILKQKEKKIPYSFFITHGIIAGIVLWIKYSIIGFWFGFMAFFFFDTLRKKEYRLSISYCLFFLLGMALPTIPILIYFGTHHAIFDLVDAYFWINLNSYSIKSTIIEKILFLYQTFFHKIIQENVIGILILLGGYFLLKIEENKSIKWAFLFCLFFLILSVYGGGRSYSYYFFIFAPFSIFGLIHLCKLWKNFKIHTSYQSIIVLLLTGSTFLFALYNQQNTKDLGKKKEDFAQYQFADTIKRLNETPTLLNYGFLDGGFYLTTNTLPTEKYFQKNNIPYKTFQENQDGQDNAIKNKAIEFVIVLIKPNKTIDDIHNKDLLKNYQVIQTKTQQVEGKKQTYYLLQRK